jgi:rubredoxin-NAD+ reductase
MPVAIKTPVCPVVVSPPPAGIEGTWTVEGEGAQTTALFHDGQGKLRGFALTGDATAQKTALAKQLPSLLG